MDGKRPVAKRPTLTCGTGAATIDSMANPDRLSALDSTFLHLEDDSTAHMHVASVMVFEGKAPTPQELIDHILSRLHLVPRYRQRLAYVPLGQGRPVWTDDPHFNPHYHIRHTALPRPADDGALKRLAGRLFSQRLDRSKPLWEIWLVQRMAGDRPTTPRSSSSPGGSSPSGSTVPSRCGRYGSCSGCPAGASR